MQDFYATDYGLITRIPESYDVINMEEMVAIKYGKYVRIDDALKEEAKHAGIISGWNDKSFVIIASKKYEFVLDEIVKSIRPWNCRFILEPYYEGSSFVIEPY